MVSSDSACECEINARHSLSRRGEHFLRAHPRVLCGLLNPFTRYRKQSHPLLPEKQPYPPFKQRKVSRLARPIKQRACLHVGKRLKGQELQETKAHTLGKERQGAADGVSAGARGHDQKCSYQASKGTAFQFISETDDRRAQDVSVCEDIGTSRCCRTLYFYEGLDYLAGQACISNISRSKPRVMTRVFNPALLGQKQVGLRG